MNVRYRRGVRGTRRRREILPQVLLNLTSDTILVITADGTILQVDRRASATLKKAPKTLLGVSVCTLFTPDECQRVSECIRECFARKVARNIQTRLLCGDGGTIEVELSLSHYADAKKPREDYCVLIARDISKELDLLRFSNIAHGTVNPLEITDEQGRIIYVNPAFERSSGFTKAEVLGKKPSIFGSGKHPREFWKKMWETITAGNVWMGEIENRRKNGDPFYTHLLISPIIDSHGVIVGYFGVHRDVTEQKHLEKHLIQVQKMESIGLLAAGIAHEVGNPLTSISSLVQVIQRSTQEEFTQEKLELIKRQISRISKIIRDLVDCSRRSSYEVQLTDVNKIVREAIEIVRVGRKAKTVSFRSELDASIPMLELVSDQIEQVFINILINAVDAIHARKDSMTHDPHSQWEGEITVTSRVEGDCVGIAVRDNGIGIPDDDLTKIFEPFFTTKKVGEGTGLGLWVSFGIVKSFGGGITVDSRNRHGATFTVRLPCRAKRR